MTSLNLPYLRYAGCYPVVYLGGGDPRPQGYPVFLNVVTRWIGGSGDEHEWSVGGGGGGGGGGAVVASSQPH